MKHEVALRLALKDQDKFVRNYCRERRMYHCFKSLKENVKLTQSFEQHALLYHMRCHK